MAPKSSVTAAMAEANGAPVESGQTWEETLDCVKQYRLQCFRIKYLERKGYESKELTKLTVEELRSLVRTEIRSSGKSSNIIDLDHTVHYGRGSGSCIPTLVSHDTLFMMG